MSRLRLIGISFIALGMACGIYSLNSLARASNLEESSLIGAKQANNLTKVANTLPRDEQYAVERDGSIVATGHTRTSEQALNIGTAAQLASMNAGLDDLDASIARSRGKRSLFYGICLSAVGIVLLCKKKSFASKQ